MPGQELDSTMECGSWCHWMWLSAKASTRHQPWCWLHLPIDKLYFRNQLGTICQYVRCPKHEPSNSRYTQIFFPISSRMNLARSFLLLWRKQLARHFKFTQFRSKRTPTSMAWWSAHHNSRGLSQCLQIEERRVKICTHDSSFYWINEICAHTRSQKKLYTSSMKPSNSI
jgi:hypothetical protein